jgi:Arc/MetJ-type ribon-helix-helix transcriptional regulator
MKGEKKKQISLSLSRETLDFLEKGVESGVFASISHGVDVAVRRMAEGERLR